MTAYYQRRPYNKTGLPAAMERIDDLTDGRHEPLARHRFRRLIFGALEVIPVVLKRDGNLRVGSSRFSGYDADLLSLLCTRMGVSVHAAELSAIFMTYESRAADESEIADRLLHLSQQLYGTGYMITGPVAGWYRMMRQ